MNKIFLLLASLFLLAISPTVKAENYVLPAQLSAPAIQSGNIVNLTLNYHILDQIALNYKVFVHFVDRDDEIIFQADHFPAPPTSSWQGALSYTIPVGVPAGATNGNFKILVGLSLPEQGRLPLTPASGVTYELHNRYHVATLSVIGQEESDPQPVVWASTFGVLPNDELDDTLAINEALSTLTTGGTLLFEPGEYTHDGQLFARGNSVKVKGYGTALHSTHEVNAAFTFDTCDGCSLYGFKLTSEADERRRSDRSSGILSYHSVGVDIADNHVVGFAGSGIMISRGTNFYRVHHNLVEDTWADAIHNTDNVFFGTIDRNVTRGSGDDGIALVGYVTHGGRLTDMFILNNHIQNNRWGRGITLEGVDGVIVQENLVENTSSAGIIIMSHPSYNVYGVSNALITGNKIVNANFDAPIGHGGIYCTGRDGSADGIPFQNDNIRIEGNAIVDTIGGPGHIRIGNQYCTNVQLINNEIADADSSKAGIFVHPTVTGLTRTGNTYNGVALD